MPEVVKAISGKVIRDLCEKLGVNADDVQQIEINPRSVVIIHEARRGEKGLLFRGDRSDVLRRITDVRIDWEAGDA